MKPRFQQAEYDGLCGFYAALNAMRFLEEQNPARFGPLPRKDQDLFNDAVDCLSAIGVGIDIIRGDGGLIEGRIARVCSALKLEYDLPIRVHRISRLHKSNWRSFSDVLAAAKQLSPSKAFAIVASCEDGRHWTAYGQASDGSEFRFDSSINVRSRKVDGRTTKAFGHEEGVILSPE
ncbi:hypothetical protein [Brevundimonas sp. UBA2416]|uniref:hypothetical protein n=1 Tax=Brevundimonas sp. UBA2416 TaxID=1946124 RepID=UPI0025C59D48|nr:hypothetical protein [Brevundimonas sp. UBA2416]